MQISGIAEERLKNCARGLPYVIDLMARLQESLAQGKKKKTTKKSEAAPEPEETEAPPAKAKPKKRRKTA